MTRPRYFLYLLPLIALTVSACATTKATHRAGACFHPLINGGQPFPLASDALFDGKNILAPDPKGRYGTLTGAMCVLAPEGVTDEEANTPSE